MTSGCRPIAQEWSYPPIAITPNGRTAYVACEYSVVPISTAANKAGKPIPVHPAYPMAIATTH